MARKPQKLPPELVKEFKQLEDQHPKSYKRNAWYPARLSNGKPVEIRLTRSAGEFYLGVRKKIKVHLETPEGEIISTDIKWEYYTVNLQKQTISYQGW